MTGTYTGSGDTFYLALCEVVGRSSNRRSFRVISTRPWPYERRSGTGRSSEARSNMTKWGGERGYARVQSTRRRWAYALALGSALASTTGGTQAQVFQTDLARTPLPQPVGANELGLGSVWGYDTATMSYFDLDGTLLELPISYGEYYAPPVFPQFVNGDAFTLQGLFKWRRERIDPSADAATSPGHFFPGCGFTAELVLRAGSCDAVLGWYNFTGSGAPPADADIQLLVPESAAYLNATRTEFVPLGWDNRNPRNLSMFDWTPHAFSSGDITAHPRYAGGDIAFALLGVPGTICKASKYSVYEHNTKNANGVPWVTSLSYRSTVDPSAIYLAFEDLPMVAADWHQTGSQYMNDGDFNDAVFFIAGLGGTDACPDPACANAMCGPDMTCSSGTCVPVDSMAGSGGADGGGAGGASNLGNDFGGAGAGQPPSHGTAGDSAGADNIAGASDTIDGGAGALGTTAAGANSADRDADAPETGAGCSCRLGAVPQQIPSHWLCVAVAVAVALRRKRAST